MARIAALLACLAVLACAPARAADCLPGARLLQVSSGGATHAAQLVLPEQLPAGRTVPLVVGLHPSGGTGRSFDEDTGLTAAATRRGFAVLLADGALRAEDGSGHFWNIPGVPLVSGAAVPAGTRDDVRFLADAIDAAVRDHCVDARRVHVTGFSGGARMSSMLACRLADRVTSIAPVGGLRAGRAAGPQFATPDPEDCRPSRPVRVLAIHGTSDGTNPWAGGGGVRWGYPVESAAARWASLDGCDAAPRSEPVAPRVTRLRYGACGAGSVVELLRIDAPEAQGGGHVWPGGRRAPPSGIDATALVLEFFARE